MVYIADIGIILTKNEKQIRWSGCADAQSDLHIWHSQINQFSIDETHKKILFHGYEM